MKYFLLFLIFICSFHSGFRQTPVSLPINFEITAPAPVITSNFGNFDGGITTVIPNPLSGGINIGGRVAPLIRNGGADFAGSYINITPSLDFSVNLTPNKS